MPKQANIVFVDDDVKAGELMLRFSEGADYHCEIFQDPGKALAYFNDQQIDLIISDLRMPAMTGTELLAEVRKLAPDLPFIIITGFANVDDAIDAIRLGATDFIKKPFDMDEMRVLIERTLERQALVKENRLLKQQLRSQSSHIKMIGNSNAMQDVYKLVDKIADVRCNVIVEGESGTGKELIAHALHNRGRDVDKPFVVIDCGALTDSLLESELFGHVKGAFTGAVATKHGLLETASGGTVFLDEIGNISDSMQTKLLRVVQEQQITLVGGVKPINIDVRFIVASNQNLDKLVTEKKFRHDLYHRLNVVKLTMPALRDRRDDIPLLLEHFIKHFAKHYNREITGFNASSISKLRAYDWPGNVRELRNLVERHVALADDAKLQLNEFSNLQHSQSLESDQPTLQQLEQRYIQQTLDSCGGNRELTATTLGINKSTLWRKLQSYRDAELRESTLHNTATQQDAEN